MQQWCKTENYGVIEDDGFYSAFSLKGKYYP